MSHADQSKRKSEIGGKIRARHRTLTSAESAAGLHTSTVCFQRLRAEFPSVFESGRTEYVFVDGIRMTSDIKG